MGFQGFVWGNVDTNILGNPLWPGTIASCRPEGGEGVGFD